MISALSGCAKLTHLQQLLTLKSYSANQDAQEEYVKAHDKRFLDLVQALESGQVSQYWNKKQLIRRFGDPIHKKSVARDDVMHERWLYRRALEYFNGEKVYFYFDPDDNLVDWEHVVPVAD